MTSRNARLSAWALGFALIAAMLGFGLRTARASNPPSTPPPPPPPPIQEHPIRPTVPTNLTPTRPPPNVMSRTPAQNDVGSNFKQGVIILYEHDNFAGRSVALQGDVPDLTEVNFNDQASSLKLRYGFQATFFEDANGQGEWFTFNCPPPIGVKQGDYCELKSIGSDIATGFLCQFRPDNSHGCVHWWNDRISSVMRVKPADMSQPQGRIDEGHE
jgi:hypothetical protein